jgi:hypothetical protein
VTSLPPDPFASGSPCVAVFGHPSHEVAIYGLLRRHRPHVVVITDGSGPKRRAQSRAGLAAIGLADRATYLGFSESAFYAALLDRDAAVFRRVADAVRDVVIPLAPSAVLCDAVEFYNPVHDTTRPVVERALRGLPAAAAWEVPLVYQLPGPDEAYEVQRVPPARVALRRRYELTPEETDAKAHARDALYPNLREQAGPELLRIPRAHLAVEEIAAFGDEPEPETCGRALRYERRARRLLAEGSIDRAITWREHVLPTVAALRAS